MSDEVLIERNISKEELDKADDSDFAGKNRSFPILKPEDVAAAARALGRAGPDNYSREQIKRNIIRIAKRKGQEFVAQLPDSWKESAASDDIAGDIVPLVEKAVAHDGTIEMRLIRPGWGASGYYSAEVLKRDGVKAWPAGTHMYIDHPTETEMQERPERSVRDLAAITISDAVYREDGRAGPGLYARASVLPQWRETIDAIAPYIGVSIMAKGRFEQGEAEGRSGNVITEITKGESIDFVTKPGAGGRVLAVMESVRRAAAAEGLNRKENENTEIESPTATVSETTEESMTEQIDELKAKIDELTASLAEANERASRAETALAILEAERTVSDALVDVSLPGAAKERVVKKLSSNPPLTEDYRLDKEELTKLVENEVKAEAEYIASIIGRTVTGEGKTHRSSSDDELTESLAHKLVEFFNVDPDAAKIAASR